MEFKKTPHINAEKDEIANVVLMPGDPLRAKYIAEKFLTDYKLVNEVRNMLAYTGYYKGKKVTVMGSGMGIASIGIYSYELYNIYDVDTIIRIGSCGSYDKNFKIGDTVLAEKSCSKSEFANYMFNDKTHEEIASLEINEKIKESAFKNNINVYPCTVTTSDIFDEYAKNLNKEGLSIVEMECYALFKNAKHSNKKAACLLTVVDDLYSREGITALEREQNLNNMILVALESI